MKLRNRVIGFVFISIMTTNYSLKKEEMVRMVSFWFSGKSCFRTIIWRVMEEDPVFCLLWPLHGHTQSENRDQLNTLEKKILRARQHFRAKMFQDVPSLPEVIFIGSE